MSNSSRTPSRTQQGSTLLVAVVILLLASLMALMAMNVGVFEQRSSGNDLRAKVVHQVAEAGLAQGFEFLMRANPDWLDDTNRWSSCEGMDKFPCTAVPAAQKDSMFYLNAGTYTVDGLHADLTKYMLPLPTALTGTGVGNVAYGVAPVLCRVPNPVSATSVSCSKGMGNLSDRRVVTFVSVAQIRGDSGRTTLTQTVARGSLIQPGVGASSVIASGGVGAPGSGDIVAMADAAGPGLDVAIWSRRNVDPEAGAFGVCDRYDFLKIGAETLTNPNWRNCKSCSCDKGKHSAEPEGWNILDADGNSKGINRDVKPEEFPCDMFEYAFNVKAWKDGANDSDDGIFPFPSGNDGFCETRMAKVPFKSAAGVDLPPLYPDEAFLYSNAKGIKGGDSTYMRSGQDLTGNLDATASGLYWCRTNCLPNNGVVGSVDHPVVVVLDQGGNIHAEIYGLLFIRSTGDGPLVADDGGNAAIKFNGQSRIFGSLIVHGKIETGSAGLIFGDKDIITGLRDNFDLSRFDTLRGGWSDRNSY